MTDLLRNGWFVNSKGTVYAVINGSAYQMDVRDTPLEDLAPGSYTDDEVMALSRDDTVERDFDESKHPRDEGGKFTSGGGAAGGGATSAGAGKATIKDFDNAGIKIEGLSKAQSKTFVKRWNERIGMSPRDFKKEFLGGKPGTMTMAYLPGANDMLAVNGTLEGANRGQFKNTIDLNGNTVHAAHLRVDKHQAGRAKEHMAANVALYQKLGMERVKLEANINIGCYAWGRYGFVPDQGAWNNMQRDLTLRTAKVGASKEEQAALQKLALSDDPKALWDIIDSPYGKDIMMSGERIMGSLTWNGTLEFNDAASMKRFNDYVAKRPAASAKSFDESKHPRDEGGKFTSGGGGGGAATGSRSAGIMQSVRDVATAQGVDQSKIIEGTPEQHDADYAGRKVYAVVKRQGPDKDKITVFPHNIENKFFAQATVMHEINHLKFSDARQNAINERREMRTEDPNAILPSGELKPEFAAKYPAYAAMAPVYPTFLANASEVEGELAESDGVSPYSQKFWNRYDAAHPSDRAPLFQAAVSETLAEMARISFEESEFPNHMGTQVGAERWRNLYDAVQRASRS